MACLFMGASVLLGGMCYGSYRYSEKVAADRQQREQEEGIDQTEETAGGTEQRVTSDTKYILVVYDEDTEESVREERSMPSEYAGMTRGELEEYLQRQLPSMKEEEAELVEAKLVSFSKEEVVIRKTYQEEEGFVLRLVDGEVAVFQQGNSETYEKTGIFRDVLTQEEIDKLEQGYSVENEKVLYSILENFSS